MAPTTVYVPLYGCIAPQELSWIDQTGSHSLFNSLFFHDPMVVSGAQIITALVCLFTPVSNPSPSSSTLLVNLHENPFSCIIFFTHANKKMLVLIFTLVLIYLHILVLSKYVYIDICMYAHTYCLVTLYSY